MPPLTGNRVVPRDGVRSCGKVVVVLQHESGDLDGLDRGGSSAHVDNAVAAFDAEADGAVFRVGLVEGVCHDPFVHAEPAARLEDPEDLLVDVLETGRMDGGFDDVDRVECVGLEVQMLSIAVSGEGYI